MNEFVCLYDWAFVCQRGVEGHEDHVSLYSEPTLYSHLSSRHKYLNTTQGGYSIYSKMSYELVLVLEQKWSHEASKWIYEVHAYNLRGKKILCSLHRRWWGYYNLQLQEVWIWGRIV